MSTVVSTGLVALDAPLPQPRADDLLAVAKIEPLPSDVGWLAGVWSGGAVRGPAYTHDPCASGTERSKYDAGLIGSQESRLFIVYLPARCTAQSVGPDPTEFIDRAKEAFAVYEAAAVERMLASGDGHTALGPYIGNASMEVLAVGSVDALAGLRLLETAVARHGSGVIHAAPSTVVAWDALNLTVKVGALTFTKRGTPVAVGAGYIGLVPDGQAPLAGDEQWAFATGPIEIERGDVEVPASAYEQFLDRSLNDVLVLVERAYVFNWLGRVDAFDTGHIQAGVLINEAACVSLISGGSP